MVLSFLQLLKKRQKRCLSSINSGIKTVFTPSESVAAGLPLRKWYGTHLQAATLAAMLVASLGVNDTGINQ